MKKIVLTGPESTGKSTLAKALSKHYHCPFVPEMARQYLAETEGLYEEKDLLKIARIQLKTEMEVTKFASDLLICDTDLRTIVIWGEVKYDQSHPWITENLAEQTADLYLLCAPDLPWEDDPLRENPDDRPALFTLYEQQLSRDQMPFKIVEGKDEQRMLNAIGFIDDLLLG